MVEGATGLPGQGKTLGMVRRAWDAKTKQGRRIYSNIPLTDRRITERQQWFFFGPRLLVKSPNYGESWADGKIGTLREVFDLDDAVVFLDEVHLWVGSHKWQEVPEEFRIYISQQRKDGVDIWWTAQGLARVHNHLRELTQYQYKCERWAGFVRMKRCDPNDPTQDYGTLWMPVSPVHYRLYDTRFKVGSADGSIAEGWGVNKKYELDELERAYEEQEQARKKLPPAFAFLRREELPDGTVRYTRSAELVTWWVARDQGQDVGPSPLVVERGALPERRAAAPGGALTWAGAE